jgi:hypothetical protein
MVLQPESRQKMRDALEQVIQGVAEKRDEARADELREREKRLRRRRSTVALLVLLAVGFGVSLAVSLPRWSRPYAPPSGEAARRDAQRALTLAASLVERFRTVNGRLPDSLAETGVALPGVEYRVAPPGYELWVTVDGRRVAGTAVMPDVPQVPPPPSR